MCVETQRFEKLMEYFKNEDNNIDFMVRLYTLQIAVDYCAKLSGRKEEQRERQRNKERWRGKRKDVCKKERKQEKRILAAFNELI